MAVARDLVRVRRLERVADVCRDRHRGDAPGYVVDPGFEGRVLRRQRAALDERRLARRLLELFVEDLRHPAGLAGTGGVLIQLLRADRPAEDNGDEHEGEPPEGGSLPVRGAPTTRACCQIQLHLGVPFTVSTTK